MLTFLLWRILFGFVVPFAVEFDMNSAPELSIWEKVTVLVAESQSFDGLDHKLELLGEIDVAEKIDLHDSVHFPPFDEETICCSANHYLSPSIFEKVLSN